MQNISEVRKVTRGYQFTLPTEFRIKNNIKEGDFIEVRSINGKLIIEPVSIIKKDPIENLKALFASQPKDKYLDFKSEKEIMNMVNKEIDLNRQEKRKKHNK